ncbi:M23 family metallopeptidase [Alteribacillus sp. HJP-4]|uniref:M23 family metallopeptidase n=1 Tax=Alteribacillus sp. HJP-4 TaxID=2775394 RepID=UPI0035CCCF15
MTFAMLQILVFQIVLPAIFIYSLWRGSFHSRFFWLLQVLADVMLIAWIFFTGRWDWIGYYVRYLWPLLLVLAIYFSWKKARGLPFHKPSTRGQKWALLPNVFILLIFGMYNVFAVSSYFPDDEPIELVYPLENGTYYVAHGGAHTQMNYHHAYEPQQYALDIVKLNQAGLRASGLYPKTLEKYAIYGDELTSPCDGEVVESRNDLPDFVPPEADGENVEGNYVALSCEGIDALVYIAHMQEGSAGVEEGDTVETGQRIGLVGNSGNTSEPHLHIHAEKNGKGVPIHFNDNFLVRNNVVR